jgi:hypothetical protein
MSFVDSVHARNVFEHPLDARLAYQDASRAAALAQIRMAVGDGRVAVLCTGAPGIGKTTFLTNLTKELSADGSTSASEPRVFPCRSNDRFEDVLAANTVVGPPVEGIEGAAGGDGRPHSPSKSVFLLDDIDQLPSAELESLVHWWTGIGAQQGASALIMTSAPCRPLGFRSRALSDLLDIVNLVIELKPFSRADSEKLVHNHLAAAGYRGPAPFTLEALEQVAFYGNGNPQRILQLCSHVIKIASGLHVFPASTEFVKQGAHDLFLPKRLRVLARTGERRSPASPETKGDTVTNACPSGSMLPTVPQVVAARTAGADSKGGRRKLRLSRVALGLASAAFALGLLGGVAATLIGGEEIEFADWPSSQQFAESSELAEPPAKPKAAAVVPDAPAILPASVEPRQTRSSASVLQGLPLLVARRETPAPADRPRMPSAETLRQAPPPQTPPPAADPQATPRAEAPRQAPLPDTPPPIGDPPSRSLATNPVEVPAMVPEPTTTQSVTAAELATETLSSQRQATVVAQSAAVAQASIPSGDPQPRTAFGVAAARPTEAPDATTPVPADQQVLASSPASTFARAEALPVDTPIPYDPQAQPRSTLDVAPPRTVREAPANAASLAMVDPETRGTAVALPAAPSAAPEPPAPWEYGTHVREAQVLLSQLGFGPGPIDGLLGPRTAAAIRAFQRLKGFETTGTLSSPVVAALRSDASARGDRAQPSASPPVATLEGSTLSRSEPARLANSVVDSCRGNQSRWIYVEDLKRYVYCSAFVGSTEQ